MDYNYGPLGENVIFLVSESHFSPIETTYVEFPSLKQKIVHSIIKNNQFSLEIEKWLALGTF